MYKVREFKGKHAGLSMKDDVYTADVYSQEGFARTSFLNYEEYSEAILKALNDKEIEVYFSGPQLINVGSMKVISLNKYVLVQEYNLQHNYYWYRIVECEDSYPRLEIKNNYFLISSSRYPLVSTCPLFNFRRAVAIARRVINGEIFTNDLINYMKVFFEKEILYDLYGDYIFDTPLEYTDPRILINSLIKNFGIKEIFYNK